MKFASQKLSDLVRCSNTALCASSSRKTLGEGCSRSGDTAEKVDQLQPER